MPHSITAVLLATLLGTAKAATHLNLTTITGRGGISVLECWQLRAPFETSNEPGVMGAQALQMGQIENASYTIVPPKFNGGLHNAPHKQYVWFISGLAHVSLPNKTGEAWINGGKYGLIYADDTADISRWGHLTEYPGSDQTISIQIPVEDGVNPKHSVLYSGPCNENDIFGL